MATDQLLFTLTPKTGFYHSNNEMAFLDGKIISYYPFNVGEPDGYVYFLFRPDGDTSGFNVRLWSTSSIPAQKMRAEFDVETTVIGEKSNFFFGTPIAGGGIKPLGNPISILGPKREILKVEYSTDIVKGALIGMYATKAAIDVAPYILRKIQVYQCTH